MSPYSQLAQLLILVQPQFLIILPQILSAFPEELLQMRVLMSFQITPLLLFPQLQHIQFLKIKLWWQILMLLTRMERLLCFPFRKELTGPSF